MEMKVHWAVKAWFVFHVLFITLWSMPTYKPPAEGKTDRPLSQLARWNDQVVRESPARHYMISTGLWQYWDMFAPNPLSRDYYGDAVVELRSGKVVQNTFPRMSQMDILGKYTHERFRKFYERAHDPDNEYLWPAFAMQAAELAATDRNDPPVRVTLIYFWRDVGPVGKDPKPWTYQSRAYYVHVVNQAKLAEAKGWR